MKDEKPEPNNHLSPASDDETKFWRKYRCTVCGHLYGPVEGVPSAVIESGTAFEYIPHDWICPICGVTKSVFILVD